MVEKRFYNIEELSTILGKSIASVHAHLARKQFDAVPPPIKLGRRLAWVVDAVEAWIAQKVNQAQPQVEIHVPTQPRKRGRPTKAEAMAKKRHSGLPQEG